MNKIQNEKQNPTTEGISYHIAENGKSWSYKYGKLHPGCYNIPTYPQTISGIHENLIPPPQPSVPMRSHLGAFSGAPPEGALITEGFYINGVASPMMCE